MPLSISDSPFLHKLFNPCYNLYQVTVWCSTPMLYWKCCGTMSAPILLKTWPGASSGLINASCHGAAVGWHHLTLARSDQVGDVYRVKEKPDLPLIVALRVSSYHLSPCLLIACSMEHLIINCNGVTLSTYHIAVYISLTGLYTVARRTSSCKQPSPAR